MILHEEMFFFTTIDNKNLGVFIFGLTILFLVCNDWLGLSHKAKLQKKKKKPQMGHTFWNPEYHKELSGAQKLWQVPYKWAN